MVCARSEVSLGKITLQQSLLIFKGYQLSTHIQYWVLWSLEGLQKKKLMKVSTYLLALGYLGHPLKASILFFYRFQQALINAITMFCPSVNPKLHLHGLYGSSHCPLIQGPLRDFDNCKEFVWSNKLDVITVWNGVASMSSSKSSKSPSEQEIGAFLFTFNRI